MEFLPVLLFTLFLSVTGIIEWYNALELDPGTLPPYIMIVGLVLFNGELVTLLFYSIIVSVKKLRYEQISFVISLCPIVICLPIAFFTCAGIYGNMFNMSDEMYAIAIAFTIGILVVFVGASPAPFCINKYKITGFFVLIGCLTSAISAPLLIYGYHSSSTAEIISGYVLCGIALLSFVISAFSFYLERKKRNRINYHPIDYDASYSETDVQDNQEIN